MNNSDCGKKHYKTAQEARKVKTYLESKESLARHKNSHKGLLPYFCATCKAWHLGRNSKLRSATSPMPPIWKQKREYDALGRAL